MDTLIVEKGADKRYHKWGQADGFPLKVIELLTQEGEIVLDPFMGGGTTAYACKQLNRKFLGFELQPINVEKAEKRLCQTSLSDMIISPSSVNP